MSNTNLLLSSLYIFTLVVVASVLLASLLFYLRKKENRHPMEREHDENVAERIDDGELPRSDM